MMKRLILLCLLLTGLCLSGVSIAQDDEPITEAEDEEPLFFRVRVQVDSAFVRILPDPDEEAVASVFRDNILEVVGRNLDGTWFEVRRPGRLTNLGWIFNEMLDVEFDAEYLPLTDNSTGREGERTLEEDPGFAVFVREGVAMRQVPLFEGERIINIPPNTTVPVLARNQDGTWLRVHYRGYEGWIIAFATREIPNVMAIPQAMGLPPLQTIGVEIIPVEIQLAQVERLREYVTRARDLALNLENFWWQVYQGEVMPCEPPPFVVEYQITQVDVRQLPELRRYVPRTLQAVEYLNSAIEPLSICGVFNPDVVINARDSAINARLIFDNTLFLLDELEDNVIRE